MNESEIKQLIRKYYNLHGNTAIEVNLSTYTFRVNRKQSGNVVMRLLKLQGRVKRDKHIYNASEYHFEIPMDIVRDYKLELILG